MIVYVRTTEEYLVHLAVEKSEGRKLLKAERLNNGEIVIETCTPEQLAYLSSRK